MVDPLVSIITPSYNQARFLEDTILTVLSQDFQHIEYILIDGGSSDGSVEIIKKYADRISYWVSESDRGQADAINKGFTKSHGEIVAWINSDDLYYQKNIVSQAVKTLLDNPNVGMVYGNGIMVDGELRLLDWHQYRQYSLRDLLSFEVLLQPAVFMRRSALEEAGFLRDEFHMVLDHSLWIRIAAISPIFHVNQYWAVERTHQEAKTTAQAPKFVEEAFRLIPQLESEPLFEPAFRGYKKHIYAGLHSFAGRRLIDAGEYHKAFWHFMKSIQLAPSVAARYWYKILQSYLGSLGLMHFAIRYRQLRRSIRYRKAQLAVNMSGAYWIESTNGK